MSATSSSDWLRAHPRSSDVPNMVPDVYNALVADIAARGMVTPLDILADGTVLDGRHRLMAAIALGLAAVPVRVVAPPDPYLYMLDAALLRRDLTTGQRAMLALTRAECVTAKAEAAERKQSRDDRSGKFATTAEPQGKSRDVAAKGVGVSARTMQDAITVAEKAPELADKVREGKMSVSAAARQVKRDETKAAIAAAPVVTEHVPGQRYRCIVIDPPWSPDDEGDVDQIGRAQPTYATMPISQIAALPVGDDAEPDCHLYLWITNRSLPKGFGLLTAWGFRYVTTLTWCKPSIGVGNYFRNNTEHVLFGIRGSLPLAAQDIGTWFQAKRGPAGHSSKPDEFYDIVRRASPGPRAEWFGRRARDGFVQRLSAVEVAP